MKISTIVLVVGAGVIGAVLGGVIGGSYAVKRTEASAAAWHWLDASTVLANADGSPKSADQQRDSLNGSFVAQTNALPATLSRVHDQALRDRVIQRSKQLSAHPDAVADTPLTMERRKQALALLGCIADAADDATAQRCSNG